MARLLCETCEQRTPMGKKVGIKKGTVQETLLLPLWGRAAEMQKDKPRLIDMAAVEIIKRLDYDFSTIEKTQSMSQHGWIARALHIDRMVLDFIKRHPEGTVVNIGCGMDTTFTRVDNGRIMFYELDLPDVIALRKHFIKDGKRYKSIASSFLDTTWFDKVEVNDGLLCIAGGVLYYVSEEEVKTFFVNLADHFKTCELFFDSLSPMAMRIAKRKVLEKGGMGMSMDGGWGLKALKDLEKWDKRIQVTSVAPIYKGMKKGVPFMTKIVLSIPDLLGLCSMVHVKVE